jgi:hypothetical protein
VPNNHSTHLDRLELELEVELGVNLATVIKIEILDSKQPHRLELLVARWDAKTEFVFLLVYQ